MKSFEDLNVWKKSHDMVLNIYRLTRSFPADEKYGLVGQMRRSAVSVCANIVEGGKKSTKDYLRFLEIARGSLEETKYYILLSRDLEYIGKDEFTYLDAACDEIGKMLYGFSRSIRI